MMGTLGGAGGRRGWTPQSLLSAQLGVGEHITRGETHALVLQDCTVSIFKPTGKLKEVQKVPAGSSCTPHGQQATSSALASPSCIF